MFNIGTVERETGIGKDTLRIWERRYGFPVPVRDKREDRLYPEEQVDRLRLIKRLLDIGMRPVKVVGLELSELSALLYPIPAKESEYPAELLEFIRLIKAHQAVELRLALNRAMLQQGMNEFLSRTVAPLNQIIGEAWLRGEIRIFEEHLYSEQITGVLRSAISLIRDVKGSPRVLLTTLPGEEHTLGLLMAEATLSMCGAHCTMLGIQTPISEIVLAATAHQVDVVTISFSSVMPAAQVQFGVDKLRTELPKSVAVWIGGTGSACLRNLEEGVRTMVPLSDIVVAVDVWRNRAL